MIRRISTKWVLAVLAAVVVPFLGFAWYVDVKLADRLSHDIVRYYLLRQAGELADRIDGAKIPTAVLYGVGGASLVTGIIVLASGGGGGEDTVSLSPTLAPDYAGVRFGARF